LEKAINIQQAAPKATFSDTGMQVAKSYPLKELETIPESTKMKQTCSMSSAAGKQAF